MVIFLGEHSFLSFHIYCSLFTSCLETVQDPAEADKLLRIQRELDETKIILVSTLF